MSEQVPHTPENQASAESTNEEKLALILDEIKIGAQILYETDFDTEEDADKMQQVYVDKYAEKLATIHSLGQTEVIMSGEGVKVPEMTVVRTELEGKGEGLFVSAGDRLLRELVPGEEVVAYISGVYGYAEAADKIDTYRAVIRMRIKPVNTVKESIYVRDTDVSALDVIVLPKGVVTVKQSFFEVARLRDIARKESLTLELARIGLVEGDFVTQLKRLSEELEKEEPDRYIPMDLDIIRSLGKFGSEHARTGEEYADIVSQVILDRLMPQRYVEVEYKTEQGASSDRRKVVGRILEVLMPASKQDTLEPTIVIEATDKSKEEQPIHLVKFDQINRLGF